jgi:N-acetylmuramoyl-L-alanine amidase
MTKTVQSVLFFSLVLCAAVPGLRASEKIQAIRDDELTGTVEVREYNGSPYVSLSNAAKASGGRLSWYRISSKAILSINGRQVSFFFNSKKAAVGTKQFSLDKPSVSTGKDLFIPLDFFLSDRFSEISDYRVQFDPGRLMTFEKMDNVSYPRIYTDENLTRIVVEFPEKLLCDFKKKSKSEYTLLIYGGKTPKGKVDFENEYVKKITLANDGRTASLKIKIKDPGLKLEFQEKDKPRRALIDIFPEKRTGDRFGSSGAAYETAGATQTALAESTYTVTAASPAFIPAARVTPAGGQRVKIMLDPGHGGDDPGAVGYNGTKEKDINLKVTLETEKLLVDDGYEVYLTRRDDTFIPLVERTNMANEKKVDFFVSIHCNASMKKTTCGFEIYFLSEKASDPEAEATARLENAVIKLEGPASMRKEKLQGVLWGMAVNEFMNESSEMCSLVTNEVVSRVKMDNRGIRQAGFFVLRGTQMPAVLIECGFLTNPAEEARLRSSRFQKTISDSIYNGVRKYVKRKSQPFAMKKT